MFISMHKSFTRGSVFDSYFINGALYKEKDNQPFVSGQEKKKWKNSEGYDKDDGLPFSKTNDL